MARREPTAEASFADILERTRLGMAMAEMIRMTATTTSNSRSKCSAFCCVLAVSLQMIA